MARDLCERLGDYRAVPIASLADEPGPIRLAAECVGIVYPVYFSGIPSIVAEIAGRLDLEGARYTFAACTMGGPGVMPSFRQLCPVQAIQAGSKTEPRRRYRHPGGTEGVSRTGISGERAANARGRRKRSRCQDRRSTPATKEKHSLDSAGVVRLFDTP